MAVEVVRRARGAGPQVAQHRRCRAACLVDRVHRRGVDRVDVDRGATRVGEDRRRAATRCRGPRSAPSGPGRGLGRVRVEDREEAGDVALDDLLVDDVGLVDAGLRSARPACSRPSRRARGGSRLSPAGSGSPVSGAMAGALAVVVAAARRRGRRRSWWSPPSSSSPPPRPRRRAIAASDRDAAAATRRASCATIEDLGTVSAHHISSRPRSALREAGGCRTAC